jgi:MFS family permease
MGVQQMGSPISTFIVAAIVAVLAANSFGWRANFYLCAVPIVLLIIIPIFVKESSRWQETHNNPATKEKSKISWREMFNRQYRKYTLYAIILHIAGGIWAQANGIWFSTGMRQDFGMDAVRAAQMTSWMWFIGIFGYFFAGKVSDMIGRKKAFLLMLVVLILGVAAMNVYLAVGNVSNIMIYAAVAVWGFGLGAHSIMITLSSEVFPSHIRAAGIGLAIGIGRLAVVVTQPLIGFFVDQTYVCRILLVIAGIYAVVLIPVSKMPETANIKLEDIIK